ncbi:MAG: hypothetical protein Q8O75_00980 [bacterium]|nr:hypothetical protein [bacterium]
MNEPPYEESVFGLAKSNEETGTDWKEFQKKSRSFFALVQQLPQSGGRFGHTFAAKGGRINKLDNRVL